MSFSDTIRICFMSPIDSCDSARTALQEKIRNAPVEDITEEKEEV